MPEGWTVEMAHKMAEHHPRESRREQLPEIIEALLLSVVAVVTAWSGYQAAKWDGRQAYLYGTSGRLGVRQRLLDVVTFNTWIRLRETKDEEAARLYEERFSPEYKIAFDAWLKTDPFKNPHAPVGPIHMPDYRNPMLDKSAQLSHDSADVFTEGARAREIAEVYVQRSVVLATVLFLTAVAQRFKIRRVRIALPLVAPALLAYQLVDLGMHPRL